MKFSNRIDNLELRSCGDHLLVTGVPHNTAEIVEWSKKTQNYDDSHCWAVAYWIKGKEGYDLKFVGARPFANTIDKHIFWMLAKAGQMILEQFFEMEIDE